MTHRCEQYVVHVQPPGTAYLVQCPHRATTHDTRNPSYTRWYCPAHDLTDPVLRAHIAAIRHHQDLRTLVTKYRTTPPAAWSPSRCATEIARLHTEQTALGVTETDYVHDPLFARVAFVVKQEATA